VVQIPEKTGIQYDTSRKDTLLSVISQKNTPVKPAQSKKFLRVPEPTLKNPVADNDNIKRTLGKNYSALDFRLACLREIPCLLRKSGFKITAVLDNNELIAIETGDTTSVHYGLAFDIGTTSVCGALVDLTDGKLLGIKSETNPQLIYGDDVISRINHSMSRPQGLEELRQKVILSINSIIKKLSSKARVKKNNIYGITILGNTTMNHLLLGIPPDSIAYSPYVPAITGPVTTKACELHIDIHPCANAYVFPSIGGYVGGDAVGLILAARLDKPGKTVIAIDLGTNSEVVLRHKGKIFAASTAAGPAFEGGHISRGMRAVGGAIETVIVKDAGVSFKVIDDLAPGGLCGSGLVDTVAELLKMKIIDRTGYMRNKRELKNVLGKKMLSRITEGKPGNSFRITDIKNGISVTQKDIREFQLAKGAICACINILMKKAGIKTRDIAGILLAGTFGNYLRRESIISIKMIPAVPAEKISFIGNAAMTGSVMGLINEDMRKKAESIAKTATYVELSDRSDFQEEFAKSLVF